MVDKVGHAPDDGNDTFAMPVNIEKLDEVDKEIQKKTTGIAAKVLLFFSPEARKELKELRVERTKLAKALIENKCGEKDNLIKVQAAMSKEFVRIIGKAFFFQEAKEKRKVLIESHKAILKDAEEQIKVFLITVDVKELKVNGEDVSIESLSMAVAEKRHVQLTIPFGEDKIEVTGLGKDLKNPRKLRGVGGFGRVCVGKHEGKDVAVKIIKIRPNKLEKTKLEVEFLLQMKDAKNVMGGKKVTYINDPKTGKPAYVCILMDRADGNFVDFRGSLDEKNRLKAVLGAARGLKELHDKGILHRDIKLENILVNKKGQEVEEVRLADLGGCIKQADRKRDDFFGTKGYLAPECIKQLKAKGWLFSIKEKEMPDKPSDIYSTGVILLRLFSNDEGIDQFERTQDPKHVDFGKSFTPNKSDYAHLGEPKATKVFTLIEKCLKENPAERIEAGALVEELEKLIDEF